MQSSLKGLAGAIVFFMLPELTLAQAPVQQAPAIQAPDSQSITEAVRNNNIQAAQATGSTCPDLTSLLPGANTDWVALRQQLAALMPDCLLSSEYFALLGAAQMNSGQLADALESLERALLLEPANGAAQIDYAEALFRQGQLFSAIELNQQILQREDVPGDLQSMLQARQQSWRGLTQQWNFQGDLLAGYDSNLNGAPSPSQITLTLSGDSVVLPLNPNFQAVKGPYANMRLGARYRLLAPEHQHNVLVELRGRVSEDQDSDLVQLDTRYAFIKPGKERSWQLTAGMSHLLFGGSPLYTATEAGGRILPDANLGVCRPQFSATVQHQLFYDQSRLNAVESKVGAGVACPLGQQQLVAEISALNNSPLQSGRPGGSRRGWQINVDWQWQLKRGVLITQFNHTETDDKRGYSPILSDGAQREIKRSYVLVQYRRPLWLDDPDTTLLFNVYHQKQISNLELFRSTDSNIEIGISHRF